MNVHRLGLLPLLLPFLLAGCEAGLPGAGGGPVDIGDCPTDELYFEHRTWSEVLQPICQDCHNPGGLARGTDFVLIYATKDGWLRDNYEMFRSVALVPEGEDSLPLVLTKSTGLHGDGHGGGALIDPDSVEYELLATMAGRMSGQLDNCNEGEHIDLGCDDKTDIVPGPRLLRRLSHDEYDATLADLMPTTAVPGQSFAPDNVVGGYDNNAQVLAVSSLLADQYRTSAEDLAEQMVADHLSSILGCDPAQSGDASCAQSFIESFGARAFRRPLSPADVDRYLGLWEGIASEDGFGVGIQWVITALLQSPHYLYRSELGAHVADGRFVLSDWEIASELSYLLWGTMPDADLFAAAAAGELSDVAARASRVELMLADPRAAETMGRFSERWLQYTRLKTVTRDEDLFPEFTSAIRDAMLGETERLIRDSFVSGATLEELFVGVSSPMTDELASYYGIAPGTGPADAEGFRRVEFGDSNRVGLLSQGSVLASRALPTSSSPIHRGLLVRERVLCQELPPPPANIDASPPEMDPSLSTRERYEAHTTVEECASCHQLIDPIGYSFEHFDAVGRWRETEGVHAIDTSGEIIGTAASDATFDGLDALSALLAVSPDVESCYVRQWMRFGFGLEEHDDLRCEAERLSAQFEEDGAHLDDVLPALAASIHFAEREGSPTELDGAASGPFDDPVVPGDDDDATGDDDDAVGDDDDAATDDDDDDDLPGAGSNTTFTLVVNNDWGSGYCADVTIDNNSGGDLTWLVEIEIDGTITQAWNTTETALTGNWVQFVGVQWNQTIPPGQTRDFGFCATR